jgi:sulfur carrier protein
MMPSSPRSWMQISVNGKPCEVRAETLAALLAELEYEDAVVATARNRDFVRRKDRARTAIAEGDEIEILVPKQGG